MAAGLKIGERAAVIQHIAAMLGKPFVGLLRVDARLGIIARHALARKEPLDARRMLQNVVLPATAGILFVIMTVLLLKVVRGGRRKK